MPHLLACARLAPDFRVDRRRKHFLAEIIFIAVAAQMCGMSSFYEMVDGVARGMAGKILATTSSTSV